MVDGYVAAHLFQRHVAIAKADEDAGDIGVFRGVRVGRGIANHDGLGRITADLQNRLADVGTIGFLGRYDVRADDGGKTAADTQRFHQVGGQVCALVCGHYKRCATRRQSVQHIKAGREGRGIHGDIGVVVGQEGIKQRLAVLFLPVRTRLGKAVLKQGQRTMTDQMAGGLNRTRRQALFFQKTVQRADQVRRGIDKSSVQIKGNRPAFQITLGHWRLPLRRLMV